MAVVTFSLNAQGRSWQVHLNLGESGQRLWKPLSVPETKKKRGSPKSVLRIPDLVHSKSAALAVSDPRVHIAPIIMPSTNLSIGIARNHAWRLTAQSF
jgi:hypothetical protein